MPTLTSQHTAAAVSARGRRAAAAAGALFTVFGLAGCSANVPPAPPPTTAASSDGDSTPPPTSPATPRSTAEAEQLVMEVYEDYIAAVGKVFEEADSAIPLYNNYATAEFGETDLPNLLKTANSQDLKAVGKVTVPKVEVTEVTDDSIFAHICTDATNANLIPADATSTPQRTRAIYSRYVSIRREDGIYKVDRNDSWDNETFCSDLQ